jgi:Vacuolar protein sorting-associated protein 26
VKPAKLSIYYRVSPTTANIQPSMAAYFFASPVDVDVKLEGEDIRKQVDVKQEKERTISCPVYYDGESIGGTVCNLSTIVGLSAFARNVIIYVVTDSYTGSGWQEVDTRGYKGGVCGKYRYTLSLPYASTVGLTTNTET